jgi:hypothetical protein
MLVIALSVKSEMLMSVIFAMTATLKRFQEVVLHQLAMFTIVPNALQLQDIFAKLAIVFTNYQQMDQNVFLQCVHQEIAKFVKKIMIYAQLVMLVIILTFGCNV